MTLTLNLPVDLEQRLKTEAESAGLSLRTYALRLLSNSGLPNEKKKKTGAEIVAFLKEEGLIGYRKDIKDSQKHARRRREQAQRRHRPS